MIAGLEPPRATIRFTIDDSTDRWLRTPATECGADSDGHTLNVFIVTESDQSNPSICIQAVGLGSADPNYDNIAAEIDDPAVALHLAEALRVSAHHLIDMQRAGH